MSDYHSDFEPTEANRSAQASVVLAALRTGPQRSADLHGLGVLAPAARVLELRRQGLRITTLRVGRVGIYTLAGMKP